MILTIIFIVVLVIVLVIVYRRTGPMSGGNVLHVLTGFLGWFLINTLLWLSVRLRRGQRCRSLPRVDGCTVGFARFGEIADCSQAAFEPCV